MKKIFIISVVLLMHYFSMAQDRISGTITDEGNITLPGATVFVPELNKGTVSDSLGFYELTNLPNGKIKIQYSYVGYGNQIETVILKGEPLQMNVELKPTAIEAEAIVISGGYNATQHENAVKIDVLRMNDLTIKNTPNFTEMLTQVPGVDMISKGSGVAKPVIRGLSMNDILVLNNGVRFENYQYSSHHPLGIDEFGIEDVEIIKGPASMLYGSDAIGGVINFIKEKPAPVGKIVGDYNMQLFSNTLGMTNNLGIKGASKKMFGGIRVGQKTNADFLQGGGDFVPNSRFNEMSLKSNLGFTNKTGTFKLFYDFNNQKLGLVEDEAVEAITERGRKNEIWYQEFNTHLLSSQNLHMLVAIALLNIPGYPVINHPERKALEVAMARDQRLLEVLQENDIQAVVGDYWQVYFLNFLSGRSIAAIPTSPGLDYLGYGDKLNGQAVRWALISNSLDKIRKWTANSHLQGHLLHICPDISLFLPSPNPPILDSSEFLKVVQNVDSLH